MTTPPPSSDRSRRDIYSVSRLNSEVRASLEGGFPLLWLEGEISNLSRPRSGHLYFSLKDPSAQVRCAMFRNRNLRLAFEPREGQQVLARVQITLYEPRGDYQLIIEHMEESGDGQLRRAFDALKQQLTREGLFAEEAKQPLPERVRTLGVVTSPSGAAIHDILSVLKRRAPDLRVILYPTAVQGPGAAEEIAAMVRLADRRKECDALIVGRGGGSLEDLWPFNEEVVARALFDCRLPVVSAVGHETDFTIADFVADRRAPTPSAAAELLSPDRAALWLQLERQGERLAQQMARQLQGARQRLAWLGQRLKHPGRQLHEDAQRLDEMELRLQRALAARLRDHDHRLARLQGRLAGETPHHRLRQRRAECRGLEQRLHHALQHRLERQGERLAALAHTLQAVSPLATLSRGYAIATHADGKVIRQADEVVVGERITARLGQGRIQARVEGVENEKG